MIVILLSLLTFLVIIATFRLEAIRGKTKSNINTKAKIRQKFTKVYIATAIAIFLYIIMELWFVLHNNFDYFKRFDCYLKWYSDIVSYVVIPIVIVFDIYQIFILFNMED